MKQGSKAELTMKKVLKAGLILDQNTYSCKILMYDMKQECIYLVLESDFLSEISLDAIYECVIWEEEMQNAAEKTVCTGRVKNRYNDENGHILKFEIENGFYKINIKSVDK